MIWNADVIKLLKKEVKANRTDEEIAKLFGCTPDAVRNKRKRLGLAKSKPVTPEDFIERYNTQKQSTKTKSSEKQLVERISRLEREREAWFKLQDNTVHQIVKPVKRNKMSATAIICLGDVHCEEEVLPESVNGLNEYNLEIADRRLNNFWNNSVRLLEITAKDTILDAVILNVLGDMITGNIHEENLENCLLQPMDAILWMQERMIGGLKLLSAKCKELKLPLTVVCKVGNHSRITDKIHISTEEGNSLEWMLYHTLKKFFPEITWIIDRSYLTYLDLYGKTIRVHHGTAIKNGGGVGGVMIAMAKANDGWNRGRRADLNICGHGHQDIHAFDTIMNASVIGYNSFAVRIKAKYEEAKQKFFLYTSRGVVTSEHVIFLEA